MSSSFEIIVGARASKLSKAQVAEVAALLPHLQFIIKGIETRGDKDQTTSLRSVTQTDFFTKEIDQMLLLDECRIAIHSAKDLPEEIPKGLAMVALTEGVEDSDSLVFNEPLKKGALIGVSSDRRESLVKAFRSDLHCLDIRGPIEKRLALLDEKKVEGVVIAEAALIRLGLTHLNRVHLKGETHPLQGKLAILAREEDHEMQRLFAPLDRRQKKVLYLGLDPSHYKGGGDITHCPVIQVVPQELSLKELPPFTHIIFTSKSAVSLFFQKFDKKESIVIAIGKVTALNLESEGVIPHYVAQEETQEGILSLLDTLNLHNAYFLLPRSSLSRPLLVNYLEKKKIKYLALDLYHTVPLECKLPDLNLFDEIVFTSPSTVYSFFDRVSELPKGKKWRAIGPVTSNVLHSMIHKKLL